MLNADFIVNSLREHLMTYKAIFETLFRNIVKIIEFLLISCLYFLLKIYWFQWTNCCYFKTVVLKGFNFCLLWTPTFIFYRVMFFIFFNLSNNYNDVTWKKPLSTQGTGLAIDLGAIVRCRDVWSFGNWSKELGFSVFYDCR